MKYFHAMGKPTEYMYSMNAKAKMIQIAPYSWQILFPLATISLSHINFGFYKKF